MKRYISFILLAVALVIGFQNCELDGSTVIGSKGDDVRQFDDGSPKKDDSTKKDNMGGDPYEGDAPIPLTCPTGYILNGGVCIPFEDTCEDKNNCPAPPTTCVDDPLKIKYIREAQVFLEEVEEKTPERLVSCEIDTEEFNRILDDENRPCHEVDRIFAAYLDCIENHVLNQPDTIF